jgi:hypothetical protein
MNELLEKNCMIGQSSYGVEAWNTETGTVELLVDKTPIEIKFDTTVNRGSMISISDSTELIFVGGLGGSFSGFEVYKYNYPQNKWMYVGNLKRGIQSPLLIPVVGIDCP